MKSWFCLLSVLAPLICVAQTSVKSAPSKEELFQWIENTRSLRSLMRSDPYRPIYHFVAPEGHAKPFDPNGAIYWNGKYHLGYIYQEPLKNGFIPSLKPALE
jgi:beta-fructofuranosidase